MSENRSVVVQQPVARWPPAWPLPGHVALVVAVVVTLTSGLAAQSPDDEAKPVTVASIDLEGVEALEPSEVLGVMETRRPSIIPFTADPVYEVTTLREDVARIEALYSSRGYPDATVTRAVADVDQEARTVAIVVTIDEGQPQRAGRVAFSGFDDIPQAELDRVVENVGYTVGAPLQINWVERIRDDSRHLLRDLGHARAAVEVTEEDAGDRVVDLRFTAVPGPVLRIGDIEVAGLTSVNEAVVRRQLAFATGDLYRQSLIDESERALRAMDLFDFAYVEPRRDEIADDSVPVRVTVTEGRHRRVDLSVGYGTEEQARAQASWRNVNLGGGARTLGVEGRASSLEWGARVSALEPYVFSRRLSLGATGHWWYENEPVYQMRTYGGRATLTWQDDTRDVSRGRGVLSSVALTFLNDFTRYSVSDFALEDAAYRAQLITLGLDPETGEGEGTLVGLRLQLQRSSVLNPLDAQQGQAFTFAVERAGGGLPGDFTYTELVGDVRAYRTLPAGIVLAARARGATIDAGSDQAVPFFKRYFLGGSTSLRGWGRYDVSPLTESGLPIGGLALFESSVEARVPVTSSLSLVGFVDAGDVWRTRSDVDFGTLRVNVGPGLRYATPIGPVRLDFGYQLTPIDGLVVRGKPESRRWRVHFSIGQAF